MKIEVIKDIQTLLSLRDEWNALLAQSRSDSVFLTHEWLSTWFKHLGENRKLAVILVRKGGELVGIAPFAERGAQLARMMPRRLEFLGSGVIGSDYLDVIVKLGLENEVLRTIADQLHAAGLMLQFGQLRSCSSLAAELASHLGSRQWVVSETKLNVCPFISLAGLSWNDYLASLSSSRRYNFQRRLKNLVKNDMRLECVRTPEEARRALEIIITLHMKRWGSRDGESEAFQTESIRAFHHEFAELAANRGWLRLLTLWLNETPVAGLYGLRYRDTFSFYQSGFDPGYSKQSAGLVMMGLAIKTAIEEGALEYDFLHGDEEYKFHWTRQTRDLRRIELFPPHGRACIYRRAVSLNRATRRMARRMLSL
ncbi:MAG: GNAT family N-acetyltransferase [Acidobacteria bacterium]|nr:GNAT family N-acetyltransferase [Acidobacteriota bacterium]